MRYQTFPGPNTLKGIYGGLNGFFENFNFIEIDDDSTVCVMYWLFLDGDFRKRDKCFIMKDKNLVVEDLETIIWSWF